MGKQTTDLVGICPKCENKTQFEKSTTSGPYYNCSSCGSEVMRKYIDPV